MIMALAEGSFGGLIENGLCKDEKLIKSMLFQMLSALDYLVSQSLVHLDVKPDNILWTANEKGAYHFWLADFGFAGNASEVVGGVRSERGTPHFMAPEIKVDGSDKSKADVWSLFATVVFARDDGASFRNYTGNDYSKSMPPEVERIQTLPPIET